MLLEDTAPDTSKPCTDELEYQLTFKQAAALLPDRSSRRNHCNAHPADEDFSPDIDSRSVSWLFRWAPAGRLDDGTVGRGAEDDCAVEAVAARRSPAPRPHGPRKRPPSRPLAPALAP